MPDLFAIDWHAVAVLGIAGLTFWLFASERLPVQTSALLAVLALMLIFGIFPYKTGDRQLGSEVFLAGFGHSALITICCLMVLGRGLVTTGALEPFARLLARMWNFSPQGAFLLMLLFCLAVSGVMNDTPIVVLMMPVLLSVAARTATTASSTLLPMNYAVLIGGMATTIGTSTNLLVTGISADLGVPVFGLFDFTKIVAVAAAVALPYLWLVAPRLLPKTETGPQERLAAGLRRRARRPQGQFRRRQGAAHSAQARHRPANPEDPARRQRPDAPADPAPAGRGPADGRRHGGAPARARGHDRCRATLDRAARSRGPCLAGPLAGADHPGIRVHRHADRRGPLRQRAPRGGDRPAPPQPRGRAGPSEHAAETRRRPAGAGASRADRPAEVRGRRPGAGREPGTAAHAARPRSRS